MTLSKGQDEYLNQQVNLFRLQYETHSLKMHLELPCGSVVALTHKVSEGLYALRLIVFPRQYFPIPSPFFQPISPSSSSHISSVAVLHLFSRCIKTCCLEYPPPCLSATVFAADLVCHPHYPRATIRPLVGSRSLSIFSQSVAVLPTHFTISAVPHIICCHPTSHPPPYPYLLSCISAIILVRRCLHC